MVKHLTFLVLGLVAIAGCRTAPVAPPLPPPVPPVTQPTLPTTFGNATLLPGGGLTITYKDLRLAVDAPADNVDFLLITMAPGAWPAILRRDLKIIATADGADEARKAGFRNGKALGSGQRLMLSKTGAFLFVSPASTKDPVARKPFNGYLLEFENGRNVFVAPDTFDMAGMREFVYALRDDGKELHLAFIPVKGGAEAKAAELASLLQPQFVVFQNRGGADSARMTDALAQQIFGGTWRLSAAGESVGF